MDPTADLAATAPSADVWSRAGCIGEGSFGAVYKAVHRETGATAAIKVVPLRTGIGGGEALTAMKQEVRILAECNHPNIIAFYGTFLAR